MIIHPFQFNTHQVWTTLNHNYIANAVRDIEVAMMRLCTFQGDSQLDYWIYGAYQSSSRYNHLQPSFIPENVRVRFHLVDPLFKSHPLVVYHNGETIYPRLIERLDDIVSIWEHPTLPYKYLTWGISAPSYDYDGWARLKATLNDIQQRNILLEFRPTESDREFVARIWTIIYDYIIQQNKPTIIIDLVKYIYDPPHRCNIPELRDMVGELAKHQKFPVIYGSWSYNWLPECYSISYSRGYRHLLHTGETTAKKIATSIKLLINDLESRQESDNSQM